jgi:hypothetical protein
MSTVNPTISSSKLFRTSVPADTDPRQWYLDMRNKVSKAPWIVHSHFVPAEMVEHLMRQKKSSAIAVKFVKNPWKPDEITNMEGALHTFVTPIVNATMHGDYQWRGGHSIFNFGKSQGYQLGRRVLMSALVQQDFEQDNVMLQVCRIGEDEFAGSSYLPQIISVAAKQDDITRRQYDISLKKYMVYHLTASHRLPSRNIAQRNVMTVAEAIGFLGDAIHHIPVEKLSSHMEERFITHRSWLISMEMMFRSAVHQVKNEFYGLELVCPQQGYVYSFNPPAIFVGIFGSLGTELLSRIHFAALKFLACNMSLSSCKGIAWNNFNSPHALSLLRLAFASKPQIFVTDTNGIFGNTAGRRGEAEGLYDPPEEAKGAMLVIHNNSDAFGQNIETEPPLGSLDGVIGAYSSSAASLLRQRKDLCDNLIRVPP